MNVHYDQKNGLGQVPHNQNIDYKGFKCWMYPEMFLRLAKRIYIDKNDTNYLFLKNSIRQGKPIGSPFFTVSWNQSRPVWEIDSHEGRHRIQAIKDLWPNELIEVHIIPSGFRSRDITPEMAQSFMTGVFAEDKTFVNNPTAKIELNGKIITPREQGALPLFEVSDEEYKKRLSKMHDKLYGQFSKILQKEKPCQFDDQGNCAGSRAGYVKPKSVCCGGCPHHGDKGCTTQALGCKSWTCHYMYPNLSPEAKKLWNKLSNKARQSGLTGHRSTKEKEIEQALEIIKYRIIEKRRMRWIRDYKQNHPHADDQEAYNAYHEKHLI